MLSVEWGMFIYEICLFDCKLSNFGGGERVWVGVYFGFWDYLWNLVGSFVLSICFFVEEVVIF